MGITPQLIRFTGSQPTNEMPYTGRDKVWSNGQQELTDQDIVQKLFMATSPFGSWGAGVGVPGTFYQPTVADVNTGTSNDRSYDVAVYGATPAGVAMAVAAARQNVRVLLMSENDRIGGMVGYGITFQDITTTSSPATVVGFAKEFLRKVARQDTTTYRNWRAYHRASCPGNPSWFIRAFNELVSSEKNISVMYGCSLSGVNKTGTTINSITVRSSGKVTTVNALAFGDCSYTGDLVAAAGCTVSIGRESTALYGETLAGIPAATFLPGNTSPDPYVTPGNPASGLLPNIYPSLGTLGDGDGRVMGFNFRTFVTNDSSRRKAFPQPNMATYNPMTYELLGRCMALAPASYNAVNKVFVLYPHLTDAGVFDMNSAKGVSSNYLNQDELKEYITASPERRAVISENVRQNHWGLIYWILNSGDSRIPAALITDMANYGLTTTDLQAYGGMSPELYVRESRRMVGDFVLNYNNMIVASGYTDAVAYGYYDFDSHQVRIIVSGGVAAIEGSAGQAMTSTQTGCPIPYRVLLPKATECTNLLSPTCPSVSRVAWLAIRLEPVLMALGQAAGIAASSIVLNKITAQAVPFVRLRRTQDIQGVLDGIIMDANGAYANGTVVQNPAATWNVSTTGFPIIGTGTATNQNVADGRSITFRPNIDETASYRLMFKYPPSATNRATNTQITINHALGATTLNISQLYGAGGTDGLGGDWEELGNYIFRRGVPSVDSVVVSAPTGTTSFVVVGAFKWVPFS